MDLRELSEEKKERTIQALSYFLKEDKNALQLCYDLLFLAHLWDDLYDQDKERSKEDINKAFQIALGEIQFNPFFDAFRPPLMSQMMTVMFLWQDSNKLAEGNADQKMATFIMRNALLSLIYYCMFLVPGGGFDWMAQEGANFWRAFSEGLHDKYLEFLKE